MGAPARRQLLMTQKNRVNALKDIKGIGNAKAKQIDAALTSATPAIKLLWHSISDVVEFLKRHEATSSIQPKLLGDIAHYFRHGAGTGD